MYRGNFSTFLTCNTTWRNLFNFWSMIKILLAFVMAWYTRLNESATECEVGRQEVLKTSFNLQVNYTDQYIWQSQLSLVTEKKITCWNACMTIPIYIMLLRMTAPKLQWPMHRFLRIWSCDHWENSKDTCSLGNRWPAIGMIAPAEWYTGLVRRGIPMN